MAMNTSSHYIYPRPQYQPAPTRSRFPSGVQVLGYSVNVENGQEKCFNESMVDHTATIGGNTEVSVDVMSGDGGDHILVGWQQSEFEYQGSTQPSSVLTTTRQSVASTPTSNSGMSNGSLAGGSTMLQQQTDQGVYAMYASSAAESYLSDDFLGSRQHQLQQQRHLNNNLHYHQPLPVHQASHHHSINNPQHHSGYGTVPSASPPAISQEESTNHVDRRRGTDRNANRDEDLSREVEMLRTEVSDLRSARESDAMAISMKDAEIRDLRGRLDDVRAVLIQLDAEQGGGKLTSAVSATCGSSVMSPDSSSTPGTHQTTQISMDVIASCLQMLQVSDLSESTNANHRHPSPPFSKLIIDASIHESSSMDQPSATSSETLTSTSPSQEDLPIRRRGSMISSNSSASSIATAIVGPNGGTQTGQQQQQGFAGVKSIWGPPLDASIQTGVGLYGQDLLSQSPTESYAPEPANVTAPAAETLLPSSSSLNQFKGLWMSNDGTVHGLVQDYECDGSEVYGMQEMIGDTSYLDAMSPNRLQHLGGMDRHANASFHYLVDKIVKTNDQPASLLLQQKLKTGNPEVRTTLFEAIRSQALPLIRNRFGNFLMQRCLEHGTPSQVRVLAGAMVGHIYALSCDRFGCHVVQKALDVCEDDVKLQIISELLRAIPETITHRFACHVWQRVFETRWSGPNHRPRVAQRVDAALKGQWHLVANDENGSLVVQCIFENCEDGDKNGIVREVLGHTIDIARGQWGNWVIQHLLEHGSPSDKQHILKVVARHVYSMSIDQFASKVVEKGLKTCQRRDLYDIVDMVLSPSLRESGPGILDMMNNQYANYVVQHILTLSDPNQRDACARLIAPHLPILRGSKYGQRVAAIVEKHIRTSQQRFGSILSVTAAQHAATVNSSAVTATMPVPSNNSSSNNLGIYASSHAASASSSTTSIHSLAAATLAQQHILMATANAPLYHGMSVPMPTNTWAHHLAQMPAQMFAAGGSPHSG
ncbi:hypothetical protein HDU67_005527 [Dinochytrium kinnereticum]|nr:hypothetical protein HDU67_005527 [Dinochytrium kinnereticum]